MEIQNQIILQGVGLETLLDRIRELIKSELITLSDKQGTPLIGGIELAKEITGLSYTTIYRHTSEGSIPHIKKGGKLYFKAIDLLKWIESGNSPANAAANFNKAVENSPAAIIERRQEILNNLPIVQASKKS